MIYLIEQFTEWPAGPIPDPQGPNGGQQEPRTPTQQRPPPAACNQTPTRKGTTNHSRVAQTPETQGGRKKREREKNQLGGCP